MELNWVDGFEINVRIEKGHFGHLSQQGGPSFPGKSSEGARGGAAGSAYPSGCL